MRRTYDTIINDALWDAFNRGRSGHGLPVVASRDVLVAIDEAGFDIVKKPEAPGIIIRETTKHADGRVEMRTSRGGRTEGYENAHRLIRNGFPSAREVVEALGNAYPDGPMGNVWEQFDRRHCLTKRGTGNAKEDKRVEAFRLAMSHSLDLDLIHGLFVHADGTITPLDKEALDAGVVAIGERPLYEWTQRPKETVTLEPGLLAELPAGTDLTWAASPPVTRDLVLFNCEDYEGNAAAAEALGLDSYPANDPVTLGWLVDEHGELSRTLSQLLYDITNGVVSKTNADMDFVHQCAGQAFVMNLLEEHPKLAEDPLFRPVMEQHFDAREISGAVEIARLRLDGNRIVRIGTFGTFNLGKDAA